MNPTGRVLIAGVGYVGSRLAEKLVADEFEVVGLRRSWPSVPHGIEPLVADVTDASSLRVVPSGLDAVVYAVSPSGRGLEAYRSAYVEGLRNLLERLGASSPELNRVLLVGSTGVYGHTDGRWVDEETPPRPGSRGEVLLEAEGLVKDGPATGIVLRLGGIYGPGRTSTVSRVLAGLAGCPPEDRYSNRIHLEDAAGAARHLLQLGSPEPLYLGVDREPAPLRDVYRWIARRVGAPDPCAQADAEVWEAAGRRGTNKRVSSDRLVASGYRFRYPTYREGYAELVDGVAGAG